MKCLLLTCLISSTAVLGQNLLFETSNRYILGVGKEKSASMSAADIDQDGDLDLVVANGRHWPEQNRVFYNNGFGIFTVSK